MLHPVIEQKQNEIKILKENNNKTEGKKRCRYVTVSYVWAVCMELDLLQLSHSTTIKSDKYHFDLGIRDRDETDLGRNWDEPD